jgi:hypothetical protein
MTIGGSKSDEIKNLFNTSPLNEAMEKERRENIDSQSGLWILGDFFLLSLPSADDD